MRRWSSMPSVPRILISRRAISHLRSASRSSASLAFSAVPTSKPSSRNHLPSESRTLNSSSTIRRRPLGSLTFTLQCGNRPAAICLAHQCASGCGDCRGLADASVQRQRNSESCASSGLRFDLDLATVSVDDALADGEAEANTLADFFRRHERLEELWQQVRGNAHSVVPNCQLNSVFVESSALEPKISAMRHSVDRIHAQRKQYLFNLTGVAVNDGKIGGQIHLQLDRGQFRLVLDQLHAALYDGIQVRFLEADRRRAREGQQVLNQLATSATLAGDQIQRLDDFFLLLLAFNTTFEPAANELGVSEDPRERVVDLVGHDGSHFPDGDHALGLKHLFVRAAELTSLFFNSFFQGPCPGGDLLPGTEEFVA